MPKLLDYSQFCDNLSEITSLKVFSKKRFHEHGLFSEQIFGPTKNYTCQCGIYHGISKSGGKCPTCGVDIVNSDVRRTRFAKITLPIPVVNPLFYDLLVESGGKFVKDALDQLMRNEKSYLYIEGEEIFISDDVEHKSAIKTRIYEKDEAIKKLVYDLTFIIEEKKEKVAKIIRDNIDNFMINHIIVLPPDLRPTSATGADKQRMDPINQNYLHILTERQTMLGTIIELHRDKKLYYTYFKQLQKYVNELYNHILTKLSKKKGLIRGNILGKRVDFSGRAVIIPDPTISITDCVLPYVMVLEIYKLPIAKRVIELGKYKLLNKAMDYVEKCIELNIPDLFKIASDVIKNEVCILNRQPSLHRLSMLGFNIKMDMDKVIKIHPLVCSPFNADFDGDQMAVYIPISDEAKQEVRDKMFVTKNFHSPANESLTTTPSQDMILGLYFLTSGEYIPQNEGFQILNECLPVDFPDINVPVTKSVLMQILNDIKDNYPDEVTAIVLDNMKRIGFKYATTIGCTMSLDDFECDGVETLIDQIYKSDDVREQLLAVNDPKLTDVLKDKFKYSFMIESGARGSWDQAKQLILTRGFISNFNGEILPVPIKHSLTDGLTQEEFFYSTYGCRKGLLDVALQTGTSGYLSRKLIFTCANLQIDPELKDCGTTDLLPVNVKNKRKARMLVNRYYLNDNKELELITKDNYQDLIGKEISIRSPILCKSPKLCTKCYGELYKKLSTRFVGIIAAQTLGERGTQLVLRTFHTSGSAIIKGADKVESMKQSDIIGDLSTVSELLHRFKGANYINIVDKLFDVYDKDIQHVHFESVVSQLMWVDSEKWRLMENRSGIPPLYYSVQSVPNKESWVLAMAFSNPKKSILNGIVNEGQYSGIMDKILRGQKIQ